MTNNFRCLTLSLLDSRRYGYDDVARPKRFRFINGSRDQSSQKVAETSIKFSGEAITSLSSTERLRQTSSAEKARVSRI